VQRQHLRPRSGVRRRLQFCFATDSWYTQRSVAYINDLTESSGWIYLPADGWVEWSDPQFASYTVQSQCCLIDVCGGTGTCPTPNGNYPCFCTDVSQDVATLNRCGGSYFTLCTGL
jgi:hypothetical protein